MINGVINVRKEKGMTSFGVIARLRRIFGQKKIGHTGTLDPDAEGVLPVCFGRATHLVEMLSRGTKGYEAVLLLGRTTDTQDAGGRVLAEQEADVTEDEVRGAILSFKGKQKQLPPMYSAIKKDGKKLVDLARRGIEVERKERDVEFFDIEVLSVDLPRAVFRVTCTHGTYIRTLCHDIGVKLGCGGCMESLLRTDVGDFHLADALTVAEIEERKKSEDAVGSVETFSENEFDRSGAPYSFISSIDYFYRDLPRVVLHGEAVEQVLSGRGFPAKMADGALLLKKSETARVYTPDGRFAGIYRKKGTGLSLERYFYEDR